MSGFCLCGVIKGSDINQQFKHIDSHSNIGQRCSQKNNFKLQKNILKKNLQIF